LLTLLDVLLLRSYDKKWYLRDGERYRQCDGGDLLSSVFDWSFLDSISEFLFGFLGKYFVARL
jgi:hypothetical protein